MSLDTQPEKKVYYRVGLFFEKVIEIDEPLPEDEVKRWATRHAMNIATVNDMNITQVEVQPNE